MNHPHRTDHGPSADVFRDRETSPRVGDYGRSPVENHGTAAITSSVTVSTPR